MNEPFYLENAHSISVQKAFEQLKSSKDGLSSSEAEERQKIYPTNELVGKEPPKIWEIFLDQFKDILVVILIVSAIISIFINSDFKTGHIEFKDSAVITIILIINAFFGTRQEWKADKAIQALQSMTALSCEVIRDGTIQEIPTRELVPGDVIRVESGTVIPADARLIEAVNLKLIESSLTGESTEVRKFSTDINPEGSTVGDRTNMIFNGTHVSRGRGVALVTETGMHTEFGKIASLVSVLEVEQTPIQQKLDELGKQLGYVTIAISLVVVLIGVFVAGGNLDDMVLLGVSLAVAAIPEGLPIVVTLAMAVGVTKMASRNAIVRKLPAVESLGAASVICTDKTGTLTVNKMRVRRLSHFKDGAFISESPEEIVLLSANGTNELILSGLLCNNASSDEFNGKLQEVGDPTELALLHLAQEVGLNQDLKKVRYLQRDELPFDSERKRMTTVHEDIERGEFLSYTKGAPDILLNMCVSYLDGEETKPLDDSTRSKITATLDSLADDALRVLAFAFKPMKKDTPVWNIMEMEKGLVFIGLMGLIDPPKPEVFDAVKLCHDAGVSIKMVTGDHKRTAAAIGRELNISQSTSEVISGPELDDLSDDQLAECVNDYSIFARISPAHKLRIVQALKANGQIVGMTGDGVNDAPALKASDIGISMGIQGTDVTKETSDMILADDNFATIVAAIEEGRAVYQSMRKFLKYMLSSNTAEILVIVIAMLINLPPPFVPIQILWINLVTDGLPALALGVDPPEPGLMKRKPRNPEETILSKKMIFFILRIGLYITVICTGLYLYEMDFTGIGQYNKDPLVYMRASSFTFATLCIIQLFNSFGTRSDSYSLLGKEFIKNRSLIYATLVSGFALFFVIQGDSLISSISGSEFIFFSEIFKVTALNAIDWVLIMFLSTSVVFFEEFFKWIFRRQERAQQPA